MVYDGSSNAHSLQDVSDVGGTNFVIFTGLGTSQSQDRRLQYRVREPRGGRERKASRSKSTRRNRRTQAPGYVRERDKMLEERRRTCFSVAPFLSLYSS